MLTAQRPCASLFGWDLTPPRCATAVWPACFAGGATPATESGQRMGEIQPYVPQKKLSNEPMSNLAKRGLIALVVLATLAVASPLVARDKSEDELIQDLASPNPDAVAMALQHIEKQYPTTTKALPPIKKLLADPREKVRRKAARVLGNIHAPVDEENLKDICALLKSSDHLEVIDGLKSLRGLKAASRVPEIVALLNDPHPNVLRDACRTLAVLGDKSTIPSIEPLLKNPNAAVQKDAEDAIFKLRSKG